jgi:hypothetical protein
MENESKYYSIIHTVRASCKYHTILLIQESWYGLFFVNMIYPFYENFEAENQILQQTVVINYAILSKRI